MIILYTFPQPEEVPEASWMLPIRMSLFNTKSAFAMSLECPRRLYYAYDSEHYANQDADGEFLKL